MNESFEEVRTFEFNRFFEIFGNGLQRAEEEEGDETRPTPHRLKNEGKHDEAWIFLPIDVIG